DGKYNPGDIATYTVTLRNASIRDPAETMSAELTFAQGIIYQTGSLVLNDPYGGSIQLIKENNKPVGFVWTGMLPKNAMDPGKVVVITYRAKVNNPPNVMHIVQNINIYDEIHFRHSDNTPFNPSPAVIDVAEHPDFSPSLKTVNKSEAVVGDALTYTVKVTNAATAQTASSVKVTDVIPSYTTYIGGSLKEKEGENNWTSLEYIGGTITAKANNLPRGATYTFLFGVTINAGAGGSTIINKAQITNLSESVTPVERTAQTVVHGSPPLYWPPEIVSQSPLDKSQNIPLKSPITVGFSKAMRQNTFSFSVKLGDFALNTNGWTVSWNADSKIVTLTPPADLEMGATYTIEADGQDQNGNQLVEGALPNPWSFTTSDPAVKIVAPTDLLVEIPVDTVSPKFTIELQDAISGKPYKLEINSVNIALGSNSATGRFGTNPNGFSGSISHVTIQKGKSNADFYYIDSTVSSPNYITITVYENPHLGWGDSDKKVIITGETKDLVDRLTMSIGSTNVYIGQFSEPIFMRAQASGKQADLPSKLYFYTQSLTGVFYDAGFNLLPEQLTVQGVNSPEHLQYASIPFGQRVATFYYLDSTVGYPIITVGDNVPLSPDTGFQNTSAVMSVMKYLEEEELEEELEEVEDETGRILKEVRINPAETVLLPGGVQMFTAKGFDTENKEIKELIFRWFAIGGGGTIEKKGIDNDSHRSIFTAGSQLGVFYDTVLVATMYNNKIGYAVATIIVADVVDYGGPTRLPTTGISGLQIIFMGLTLMAAVALAWVTSYEKTHFSKESNE
ncbi:MAG: DUF11 domain-containing protein, partial [Candidatus Edwardsbacteria bacterium]|nr:DUF11 domain-containing protein [Candidatus Edwardsbacteria bacterium]